MLKLSYTDTPNKFAVPDEKYVVKTKTSPDLKIMTYLGNGEFKRDLFGFDVGLKNYKIKSDDTERYVVPLATILKNQSYKKLMRKEEITKKGKTTSKYIEDYSFYLNFVRKSLNDSTKVPTKVPAELVEGNDVLSDDFTKQDLLNIQLDLSANNARQEYLAQFM